MAELPTIVSFEDDDQLGFHDLSDTVILSEGENSGGSGSDDDVELLPLLLDPDWAERPELLSEDLMIVKEEEEEEKREESSVVFQANQLQAISKCLERIAEQQKAGGGWGGGVLLQGDVGTGTSLYLCVSHI